VDDKTDAAHISRLRSQGVNVVVAPPVRAHHGEASA